MVVFGQNGCIRANVVAFEKRGFIRENVVEFVRSGCTRAKLDVLRQKWL